MSLIGQLSPQYGNADTVGILRDIDLVIGMGYESEKLAPIFKGTRDKVISLLSVKPNLGASVRNQFFESKDDIVDKEVLSDENKEKMTGVDMVHWEYERLMFLRQRFERNPESTLQDLIKVIDKKLKDFPINKT
ncbi:hypothetical protein K2X92_04910, partial [Candidatus Gracilibacteria bacterium]|nr:hypothetical protein [Candidatus Gracilibacteria bacterium]